MDEILASIRRIISEEDEGTVAERPALQALRTDVGDAGDAPDPAEGDEAPAALADDSIEEDLGDRGAPVAEEAPAPAPAPELDSPAISASSAAEAEAPAGGEIDAAAAPSHQEAPQTISDVPSAPATPIHQTEEAAMAPAAATAPAAEKAQAPAQPDTAAGDAGPQEDAMVSDLNAKVAATAFGALRENIRISEGRGRTLEDIVEAMLKPMIQSWLDENLPRIVEEKVEDEVRRIARRR